VRLSCARLNAAADEPSEHRGQRGCPQLGEDMLSVELHVLNYRPIVVEKALYWEPQGRGLGERHECDRDALVPP
jgi:hypothetical protein